MQADTIIQAFQAQAIQLPSITDPDFAKKFDFLSQTQLVLLGDGSHGTQEFYAARAAISRYLIEVHGFNAIVIEADHCNTMCIDQKIRHRKTTDQDESFQQPSSWIWKNQEFDQFIEWLERWNADRSLTEQTAMYGLDLQKSKNSMHVVCDYLSKKNSSMADTAHDFHQILKNFMDSPYTYIEEQKKIQHEERYKIANAIHDAIIALEPSIHTLEYAAWFDAFLSSLAVVNGINFDKACLGSFTDRWNARETHMITTLDAIITKIGVDAKVIVWAHNSHVGNAAFTAFNWVYHFNSLGQSLTQHPSYTSVKIGFGTHSGTLLAARKWGENVEELPMQEPLLDSWEHISHAVGLESFLLNLSAMRTSYDSIRKPYRSFGTYYDPAKEKEQCYFETELIHQFDYWVWFDQTSALTPSNTNPHN